MYLFYLFYLKISHHEQWRTCESAQREMVIKTKKLSTAERAPYFSLKKNQT